MFNIFMYLVFNFSLRIFRNLTYAQYLRDKQVYNFESWFTQICLCVLEMDSHVNKEETYAFYSKEFVQCHNINGHCANFEKNIFCHIFVHFI